MSKQYLIGIDVGGSSVKVGLIKVGKDGNIDLRDFTEQSYDQILKDRSVHKSQISGADRVKLVQNLLRSLLNVKKDVQAIGVATTGTVDPRTGVILDDWNDSYKGTNWLQIVRSIFDGVDVKVVNDARAAAWAEFICWNTSSKENLVLPTSLSNLPKVFTHTIVGSGIGAGIILERRLFEGTSGVSGEIGTIEYTPKREGLPSSDIESFASSTGILNTLKKIAPNVSAARYSNIVDVNQSYLQGDRLSIQAVELAAEALGFGLVALINILGPEVITFGGGTIEIVTQYIPLVEAYVRKHAEHPLADTIVLQKGKFTREGGVIGAALLAHSSNYYKVR